MNGMNGMKRTFLVLLLAFAALYAQVAYKVWTEDPYLASSPKGRLSDIAQSVTAIPLQAPGSYDAEKTRSIRRLGDRLFLINKDILYSFDASGRFVCQITHPDVIRAAEYAIDPLREQLIVFGNEDDIHYYTFGGELKEQKKAAAHIADRIRAVAMHEGCIWTIEERVGERIEQRMVQYDAAFREIGSSRLLSPDWLHKPFLPLSFNMEIAADESSGVLYACASPLRPDYLLRDSLLLKYRLTSPGMFSEGDERNVFPLRLGPRFWIASSYDPDDASRTYAFCFDRETNRSWQLSGGFEDDFYGAGPVAQWQPMDLSGRRYSFCKSGEAVKHISSSGAPVVFIVELKV
jgi:hypothetical protein